MRRWSVVGGLIHTDLDLLLVANRRRNGRIDWSPPGGVVDAGEDHREALTREVAEETGLSVLEWRGPVYDVEVAFVDLAWHMRVASYVAVRWEGDLVIDDPDGIVEDAQFLPASGCLERLVDSPRWVSDGVAAWLHEPWDEHRVFRYVVRGTVQGDMTVETA